ncbi:hypothetical protein CPC16_001725 [Podila verticillata]|nr:hypothetical protein CPC16_001725 [Podila verticillata]
MTLGRLPSISRGKQPVVLYLIRDTLKDIFHLASSQSSEPVNITAASVEQIKLIAHPSSFDDKQRRGALDRIYRELGQQFKVNVKHAKARGRAATDDVNILLVDDVVSGKTSLIEAMKPYAKPGVLTETSGSYRIVDIVEDANTMSQEAFDDLMNLDQARVTTRRIRPDVPRDYRFGVLRRLFSAPEMLLSQRSIDYRNIRVRNNQQFHDAMEDMKEQFQNLIRTTPPIFGEESVDKSTLVQHIKKYADPAYTLNYTLLENGVKSMTTPMK